MVFQNLRWNSNKTSLTLINISYSSKINQDLQIFKLFNYPKSHFNAQEQAEEKLPDENELIQLERFKSKMNLGDTEEIDAKIPEDTFKDIPDDVFEKIPRAVTARLENRQKKQNQQKAVKTIKTETVEDYQPSAPSAPAMEESTNSGRGDRIWFGFIKLLTNDFIKPYCLHDCL